MAAKKPKSSAKKKTARSTGAKKSGAPARARKTPLTGRNPFAVLIIMAMAAAIILLVHRYHREDTGIRPVKTQSDRTVRGDRKDTLPERMQDGRDDQSLKKAPVKTSGNQDARNDATPEKEAKIYLVRINEKTGKSSLISVPRSIRGNLLENTMIELARGPTTAERRKGLLSAVPPDLRINGVTVKNGTAVLDFNGAIERGASGSVLIDRIDQIVYTATQFPTVERVVIKINGRYRETLGTDGLSIGGPLHRRE